jgi:hypothetical protein
MNETAALVLSIALTLAATAASAQQPPMKVDVLAVESVEGFQRWLQEATDAAKEQKAALAPYPPGLKEVPASRKVHFPILVSGLRPPEQGVVTLVGDVEFFGPDGKSIGAARQCCKFTINNRPDIRTAMLGPMMNLEWEPSDKKGIYTVRVSVTDGSQTAASSATIQYGGGNSTAPREAPASTAAPKLRMDVPAKNPGRDMDKRDCLALPTPAEVIKCTEQK